MITRYGKRFLTALLGAWLFFVSIQPVVAATLQHQTLVDALGFLDSWSPPVVAGQNVITSADFLNQLKDKRVVYVAEIHDRYDHHLNQLMVLRHMHRQNPQLGIGVEWFQQSFQPVIDQYLAGTLSEADMLRQTDYYQRWRYDYRLLRPIMEYAKAHRLPVIALNAPSELTAKVAAGGLESLTPAERKQLPPQINPPDPSYLQRLEQVFADHAHGHGKFDHFALVQRIWDESMAYNVVRFLNQHPKHRMIVFAGAGHISSQSAIPVDVKRYLPQLSQATVHSVDVREAQAPMVDYQIISRFFDLPPTGKLGIWLQPARRGLGVMIGKLLPNSPAADVGLNEGDRIVSLNGQPIQGMADILLALSQFKPKDKVKLGVKQPDLKGQPPREVFFMVTLQ